MTLFEIDILIHYQTRATDYRDGDFSAEILPDTLFDLVAKRLLSPTVLSEGPKYKIGERGKAYVEALKAMPLPVSKWVMPSTGGG